MNFHEQFVIAICVLWFSCAVCEERLKKNDVDFQIPLWPECAKEWICNWILNQWSTGVACPQKPMSKIQTSKGTSSRHYKNKHLYFIIITWKIPVKAAITLGKKWLNSWITILYKNRPINHRKNPKLPPFGRKIVLMGQKCFYGPKTGG